MKLAAHPRARQGAIPNGAPADTAPSFPPLPVRAAPAGDILPQIVIDTREQTPLTFRSLPSRPGTLTQGDYSVAGLESDFAVERKSLPDLVASLTRERERFMREVDRLRGCPFARLLVIGSEADLAAERYRSNANPTALLHGLHSIEARGLPVVFAGTPEAAAALVERWAWWRARAVLQAANALLRESDRATCTPPPGKESLSGSKRDGWAVARRFFVSGDFCPVRQFTKPPSRKHEKRHKTQARKEPCPHTPPPPRPPDCP